VTTCPQRQVTDAEYLVFEELPHASPDDLRRTFRRYAAGVAVVTANGTAGPIGFTVTSLASVSADPPRVSFNIAHTASSWPAVSLARYVGIHLLGAEQVELAATFARSGADRFAAPTVWTPGPRRVPIIDGCVSWMVAAVQERVAVGDHSIVVAKVLHAGGLPDVGVPLLYHDGGFRRLADDRAEIADRRASRGH
jgi:flavin reductase (DIM6/NTAB) family NADH-FMN oxidoreductase RutF